MSDSCVTLTETTCTVHDHMFALRHRAAWEALLAWAEFHGLPVGDVPMVGTLTRHVRERCVEYTAIVRDEHGHPTYHAGWADGVLTEQRRAQGETPPLPWPAELQQLCWGSVQHDGHRGRPMVVRS